MSDHKWFVYVGPGDGVGAKHMLLSTDGGDAVTWSVPVNNGIIGGWSWMGPISEFKKQFQPVSK
jgi:hypothetical protein